MSRADINNSYSDTVDNNSYNYYKNYYPSAYWFFWFLIILVLIIVLIVILACTPGCDYDVVTANVTESLFHFNAPFGKITVADLEYTPKGETTPRTANSIILYGNYLDPTTTGSNTNYQKVKVAYCKTDVTDVYQSICGNGAYGVSFWLILLFLVFIFIFILTW